MNTFKYNFIGSCVTALLLLSCAKEGQDVVPSPVETLDAVDLQQWFRQHTLQTRGSESNTNWVTAIEWNNIETWGSGTSRIHAIPLKDHRANHFTNISFKGDRRLVIWIDKGGKRQANLIEIYRQGAELPVGQPLQQLLGSLVEGLRSDRNPTANGFDGMAAIYTPSYTYKTGYAFQQGKVTGNYRVRFTYTRKAMGQQGDQSLSSARFQSTLANTTSCNGFWTCEQICGTVSAGDVSGSTTCVEGDCQPTPTQPSDPGSPPTGGDEGGTGPWGGYPDPGTGYGEGELDHLEVGNYGRELKCDYLLGNKLNVRIEVNTKTQTIEKLELFMTGTFPPGTEFKMLGDGTGHFNNGVYTFELAYQVKGFDGTLNSKAGHVYGTMTVIPDNRTYSGYSSTGTIFYRE